MKLSAQKFTLLVALIALDAITKVAAYLLLSPNHSGSMDDLFHFNLIVNHVGLGTSIRSKVTNTDGLNQILIAAIICIGMSTYIVVLTQFGKLTLRKLIAGGFIIAAMGGIASGLNLLPDMTAHNAVLLLRAAEALLWFIVWLLVARRHWAIGATFYAAAAIGNFLSFLYPPYGIVDFMWSSLILKLVHLQVFNFADLMWLFGIVSFGFALIIALVEKIKNPRNVGTDPIEIGSR